MLIRSVGNVGAAVQSPGGDDSATCVEEGVARHKPFQCSLRFRRTNSAPRSHRGEVGAHPMRTTSTLRSAHGPSLLSPATRGEGRALRSGRVRTHLGTRWARDMAVRPGHSFCVGPATSLWVRIGTHDVLNGP